MTGDDGATLSFGKLSLDPLGVIGPGPSSVVLNMDECEAVEAAEPRRSIIAD
jgi:hypothetical protein